MNTCTSPATPCATIQHAIDVADAGDTILVAGGTYSRTGTVAAVDKELIIEGGYSDDFSVFDPANQLTVLDAQWQGSVVTATNVSDLMLHHLILTHGDGTGNCLNGCGGGIYARNTELRVGRCIISDNVANSSGSGWGQGGGIYSQGGPFVHIWHTRVISNSAAQPATVASEGDGIYVAHGVVRIEHSEILSNTGASGQGSGLSLNFLDSLELLTNTIQYNHTTRAGGGLFLSSVPDVLLAGNTIEANRCDDFTGCGIWMVGVSGEVSRNRIRDNFGSAVDIYSSRPLTFSNNLLSGNLDGMSILGNSPAGSWVLLANNTIVDNGPIGIQAVYTTTLAITNTLVAGHVEGLRLELPYFSGTYSIETSLFWNTSGNPAGAIEAEPLLDPLYQPMKGSPALNAGTTLPWLTVDLRGRPRPVDSAYDIGAFEGTGPVVFLPLMLRGAP
jgi:hypothetical protein